MDWHHSLLFLLICGLGCVLSNADMCHENKSVMRDGTTHYYTRYYCCLSENLITENGNCTECSIGYIATEENDCVPCNGQAYGQNCLQRCQCSYGEMCDHIQGCINTFKSTKAGKSSPYSKETEWHDYKSTEFVDTIFESSKSSHSFSTRSPDVGQKVNIEKKDGFRLKRKWPHSCSSKIFKGSSSISSHLMIYVMCTGCLAVIIGLSILLRRFCYRQTINFCLNTKTSVRIANNRNDNYSDEFLNEVFELERYGSIYDIIDEQNMIENVEH